MNRKVTVFVPIGNNRWETGFATEEEMNRHMQFYMRRYFPNGYSVESREIEVPPDCFWTGDTIEVELHRGGFEDEDGIHTGGSWRKTVGVVEVDLVQFHEDGTVREITGVIRDQRGAHLQCMTLRTGVNGFPYRNARLMKEKD